MSNQGTKTRLGLVTEDISKSIRISNDNELFYRKVYQSENLFVELTTSTQKMVGPCTELNPESISLVVHEVKESLVGQFVEVLFKQTMNISHQLRAEVIREEKIKIQNEPYTKIVLNFVQNISNIDRDLKIGKGYNIPAFFQPQAYADDPIFLGEPILFRVVSVHAKGMTLATSIRNKNILPGFHLNLSMMVPYRGEFKISVDPFRVYRESKNESLLLVDVIYKNVSAFYLEAITEFLLGFVKQTSVLSLRKEGFFIGQIENAISISAPQDGREWEEVLKLRLDTYHSVGKMKDKQTTDEVNDKYDEYSRKIVCKVGSKIVGSIRVVFVGKELSKSEHANLGISIPDFLVKGGFVEFSRACIHTEFRGTDILTVLMRHATRVAIQDGMPYVVANCNPEQWPTYKMIGGKKIGPTFEAFGRKDCQLIYFDCKKVLRGWNGTLFSWTQFMVPLYRYLRIHQSREARMGLVPWLKLCLMVSKRVRKLLTERSYKKYRKKQSAAGRLK